MRLPSSLDCRRKYQIAYEKLDPSLPNHKFCRNLIFYCFSYLNELDRKRNRKEIETTTIDLEKEETKDTLKKFQDQVFNGINSYTIFHSFSVFQINNTSDRSHFTEYIYIYI